MKYLSGLILLCACFSVPARAQDNDAFLSCADISDRNERLQCLENALNEAVEDRDGADNAREAADTAAVGNAGPADPGPAIQEQAPATAEQEAPRERSLFRRIGNIFSRGDKEDDSADGDGKQPAGAVADAEPAPRERVEDFGREARVVTNDSGADELHDTITELYMAKPNQWLIRLASGQIWRQTTPKRLNLREGDEVRIYPSHWGDNYRLEATRLNGYIQIVRVEE